MAKISTLPSLVEFFNVAISCGFVVVIFLLFKHKNEQQKSRQIYGLLGEANSIHSLFEHPYKKRKLPAPLNSTIK